MTSRKQMEVLKILYNLEEPIPIVGQKVWGIYEICEKDRRFDYMIPSESHIDDDELLRRIYQRNEVHNWWRSSTSNIRDMINNLVIKGLVKYIGEHKCGITDAGRYVVDKSTGVLTLSSRQQPHQEKVIKPPHQEKKIKPPQISDKDADFYTRLSDENLLQRFLDDQDDTNIRRKLIKCGVILKGKKNVKGPVFTDYGKKIRTQLNDRKKEEM